MLNVIENTFSAVDSPLIPLIFYPSPRFLLLMYFCALLFYCGILCTDSAEPGPSGLASSAVDEDATAAASSHITSTSDVVCLDDDEDDDVIIVLSDSDPTT